MREIQGAAFNAMQDKLNALGVNTNAIGWGILQPDLIQLAIAIQLGRIADALEAREDSSNVKP